ncbi:MAG: N-acetyltransferase family protein [Litoreibacter sp.]|uniref:GNAT family N-acetyltransferase n=1 Tax=Litoreibacter sp. TaxID=1969459 RepID=UPI003298AF26
MTLIRPAQAKDAAGICAILNPIIANTTITFSPDPITQDDVIEGLSNHAARAHPYLVAEDDSAGGAVVGYAKYGPFRAGAGYARTVEITVHLAPCARGQGLGRKLVKTLEDHARATKLHALVAGISSENTSALNFHTKLGFETVGTLPQVGHKFGRFIDLVLMQKYL